MTIRHLQYLLFTLLALTILVRPMPDAALASVHLFQQLPQKHPHLPLVSKSQIVLTTAARSSSTNRLRSRQRSTTVSSISDQRFTAGASSAFGGLQRVFRPLRC